VSAGGAGYRGEIVFVHGFLGGPEDFDPLRRMLPRYRIRTVDLLEYRGRELEALSRELARTVVKQPTCSIIGYSLGGRIVLRLAEWFPQVAARFIAISAHPGLRDPAERARRAAADDRLADGLLRDGMEAFVDRWYAQPLFDTLRGHPDFTAIRDRRSGGPPGPWAAILRGCSPGRTEPTWDALRPLGKRLVFIAGELDPKYRLVAAEVEGFSPEARIHVIPGAGHAVHLERPEALAATLAPYLDFREFGGRGDNRD
jgi:2-succinyl-6-hydroxy-2,4-cyclohexadiene-1-carboxylate synthase